MCVREPRSAPMSAPTHPYYCRGNHNGERAQGLVAQEQLELVHVRGEGQGGHLRRKDSLRKSLLHSLQVCGPLQASVLEWFARSAAEGNMVPQAPHGVGTAGSSDFLAPATETRCGATTRAIGAAFFFGKVGLTLGTPPGPTSSSPLSVPAASSPTFSVPTLSPSALFSVPASPSTRAFFAAGSSASAPTTPGAWTRPAGFFTRAASSSLWLFRAAAAALFAAFASASTGSAGGASGAMSSAPSSVPVSVSVRFVRIFEVIILGAESQKVARGPLLRLAAFRFLSCPTKSQFSGFSKIFYLK